MQQLRIGIVGCGEVTQIMHLPSLDQLADRFSVTALCDVSDMALRAVGERWGVTKRYRDHNELLAQDDVDAVLVANPIAYHADVTLAAIAAGKHVLVEKPMCMTLREADEIRVAQEQSGVTVQVGYMRRYAPAFVEAVRLIPELGDIRLARVHDVLGHNALFIKDTSRVVRGTDVPPAVLAAGKQRNDMLTREAIGDDAPPVLQNAHGLMLGLGSHDISAMRELLGMPQRVLYAAQRHGGRYVTAAFDYGSFVCHYETGIDDIPRFDAYVDVFGDKCTLRVKYDTPYVRNLPIELTVTEANGKGGVVRRTEHPSWSDPFVSEWQAFHLNVTQHRMPKSSPADFRQDLELFREMIVAMSS